MRRTDPRELLHPVLPAETYRRLGITPPGPPRGFAPGGPLSAAGTPYVTGRAVSGAPAPLPGRVAPAVAVPQARPAATPPPRRDRTVPIVVGAATLIIAIIIGTTMLVLFRRGDSDTGAQASDERQIRDVIAAETTALNNRDLTALLATHCTTDVRRLERTLTPQTFAFNVDMQIGARGRLQVTVGAVTVDGDSASAEVTTVPVNTGVRNAQTVTDTTTLRKESGGWKVCENAGPGS